MKRELEGFCVGGWTWCGGANRINPRLKARIAREAVYV